MLAHLFVGKYMAHASLAATSVARLRPRISTFNRTVSLQLVEHLLFKSESRLTFAVVGVVFSSHHEIIIVVSILDCYQIIICIGKYLLL